MKPRTAKAVIRSARRLRYVGDADVQLGWVQWRLEEGGEGGLGRGREKRREEAEWWGEGEGMGGIGGGIQEEEE